MINNVGDFVVKCLILMISRVFQRNQRIFNMLSMDISFNFKGTDQTA